jgi:hypothetical protein
MFSNYFKGVREMSRSYKKVPGYTDYSRNATKFMKRQASKKVRKACGIDSGKVIKNFFAFELMISYP